MVDGFNSLMSYVHNYSMYTNDFSKDKLHQFSVDTHMWFTLVCADSSEG